VRGGVNGGPAINRSYAIPYKPGPSSVKKSFGGGEPGPVLFKTDTASSVLL